MPSATVPLFTLRRLAVPPVAMTIYGIVAAMTFSASGSAPTPLYRFYQQDFGLSALLLTVIFAVYALSLLAALLTVGSLSDYIGRRPVILAALLLNLLAMWIFSTADSAAALVAARVVQGFATGAATTTLGAAILDTSKRQGPFFNSITAFCGLTIGSIGSAALVAFAPDPHQLVYLVLLAASGVLALLLLVMPETAARRPGALASLVPHVHVPRQARATLLQISPVNIAAWALGGFYFSLMPSLVRVATGVNSPFVGGIVVAALTAAGATAVVTMRKRPGSSILTLGTIMLALGVVVTLSGVYSQQAELLLAGTIIAGLGFGSTFSGTLRTLLPLAAADQRAGLLSAFYVESYLAFSLPAILIGLAAPLLGLLASTYVYGSMIILLALMSLAVTLAARRSVTGATLSID